MRGAAALLALALMAVSACTANLPDESGADGTGGGNLRIGQEYSCPV
jgi:hypothetical protein